MRSLSVKEMLATVWSLLLIRPAVVFVGAGKGEGWTVAIVTR